MFFSLRHSEVHLPVPEAPSDFDTPEEAQSDFTDFQTTSKNANLYFESGFFDTPEEARLDFTDTNAKNSYTEQSRNACD